ncbi:hypothetical protein LUZ62_064366 [Rhynchospora pubera]|uniref:Phosphatidylinositol 3,4,5-trisphosphate 3-phosphatase and protein-tyrosine-phosphatase PTEN2A-like n=1 Tax=Rhynchospora pubera TaxID=906938 RepID=A0AAV8EI31_9POAL|nr:hypothetical protein LUZ62_064366 [Rhynchospora pubera]
MEDLQQEVKQQTELPTTMPPVRPPEKQEEPSRVQEETPGLFSWARNLKIPQPSATGPQDSPTGKSTFSRLTSGLGLRLSPKGTQAEEPSAEGTSTGSPNGGVFGTLTKGIVDTSKNAVKAVQVKARHMVSQNKRRYQEGGFDLDMTYITENIIAMGFPAGDMSSGFFGYVEGFYRNHMEEVIKFFETHHKGKYKVYNLCSERLYDASLLEGKVACFPFDDHNCPPIQLIISFCHSAYSWLKEDIENVVVVHCKAGMARTGLMISSLLLYLKFFPTAEEAMEYYNQKRCIDGKGLVLPSQIRYVKYFERILTYFNCENPPSRRCMLRGFRLHKCPYWIRPSITISNHNGVLFSTKKHPRTKDLMPEDFWFSAPKRGIMVFALPGEPGLTEVVGDFKVHFHDRQGDFYCWLNTTMMENRTTLGTADLDGFDKRKLPSSGFEVEVVLVDYNGPAPASPTPAPTTATPKPDVVTSSATTREAPASQNPATPELSSKEVTTSKENKNDVFSDNESEENKRSGKDSSTSNVSQALEKITLKKEDSATKSTDTSAPVEATTGDSGKNAASASVPVHSNLDSNSVSEFKAIAADASVFSFGDEEDYESE